MKIAKGWFPLLALAALVLSCVSHKDADTASAPVAAPKSPTETVIDAYLKAAGGVDKLEGLKDITMEADMAMMGQTFLFIDQRKAPNKQFSTAKMGEMAVFSQTFDGEKGVTLQMGNKTAYGEDQINRSKKSYLVPELHFEDMKVTPELDGEVDLDGKPAYKVVLTNEDGKKSEVYFDKESNFKVKYVTSLKAPTGQEMSQVIQLKDYRPVDGYQLPHKLIIDVGMQHMEFTVKSYKINQNLSDDLFKVE